MELMLFAAKVVIVSVLCLIFTCIALAYAFQSYFQQKTKYMNEMLQAGLQPKVPGNEIVDL